VRGRRGLLVALPLLVFAGLAGLFLWQLTSGRNPATLPSTLIGRSVPAVSLPPLDGLVENGRAVPGFSPADLATGQVTLVNVFGSWCPPCHAEHPYLVQLQRERGTRIFGINQRDTPDNARRFLASKGNPYAAVGVDPNGRGSIEWGVYGAPETFVVDGRGIVRWKLVGPITAENLPQVIAQMDAAAR
jgi:cytochrome c biogenesis protein CcmG/thiol:disulfide interchange protein DsbE